LQEDKHAEICYLKQKGVSQVKLAEQFFVAEATISNIIREKDRWLSLKPGSNNIKLKRQRTAKFLLLEEALALWVSRVTEVLQTGTEVIITHKVVQLAEGLGIIGFNTSEGWLSNFKKYYHIKEYRRQGEAASMPLEDFPRFRNELYEIIKEYKPEDIYNRIEPDKTLASSSVLGEKKAKDCMTILLTCNATGEHKLPPLFIHKYKNPRALHNVDKSTLPVYYYWNSTAWMQTSIFNRYIKHFDDQMRLASWSILLLMDGASTHGLEESYTPTNIKLHILPLNTTAHLQLCNARIIWSFKAHYKKIFCQDRIDLFDFFLESGESPEPLNIKNAIDFTATAWKKVTSQTIRNCWEKTGILPKDFFDELFLFENSSLTNELDLIDEIQNLIRHAHQYIIADNDLIATEILTNKEIIESVKNHEYIEPEDESSKKLISFVQALEFIKGISSFLEQQPDGNFKVKDSFIWGLRQLKKEVNFKYIASKQQATLDTFIHNTN
ncbi:2433_t:CDS:2, partial [Scutellospora calospora]